MKLNPVMENFYLSVLDYAGLVLDNNSIKNKSEKLGEFSLDGKEITLPYLENLKNPNGKLIFHPLNENYIKPETAMFNLYKRKLVLEINLKILSLFIAIVNIANSIELQNKIKSTKLIELISNIGETDMALIEHLLALGKASRKVNDESFIVDIFLKKNGEIDDVPYAAIGKVNFILYNEINKALDDKERDYKVFGYKLRKKDLLAINNMFNAIFPNINDQESYIEGTDNKIFRFFNILLKTSYLVTNRINEIAGYLKELKDNTLNIEDIEISAEWTESLEDLYKMATEIRLIPNQTDISTEESGVNRLKVDESSSSNITTQEEPSRPVYAPQHPNMMASQPQTNMQVATSQPIVNRTPTAEEILRGGGMNMNPMPMYQMPVQMMPMNNGPVPSWIVKEQMTTNQPMMNPNMPIYNPNMGMPMMNTGMPVMMYNPNMPINHPNMNGYNPNMPPNIPPNMMQPNNMDMSMNTNMNNAGGIAINPAFLNRSSAGYR